MAQLALSTHAKMLMEFGINTKTVSSEKIQAPTAKPTSEETCKESITPGLSLDMIMQECMTKKAGPQNTPT
ncbi:MAG: hypothetical protein K2X39_00530 [Silvanigrellaceae bacterium]|nr:hypothetical protein [Silvanigrellaceae bacterium]